GWGGPPPRPVSGHGPPGVCPPVAGGQHRELRLFGSYHPSQRNSFTGRLTPAMLREVLADAARAADLPLP
ncbi:uracil-DNA glycosylase, partial [Streptomyces sp. NPDC059009]